MLLLYFFYKYIVNYCLKIDCFKLKKLHTFEDYLILMLTDSTDNNWFFREEVQFCRKFYNFFDINAGALSMDNSYVFNFK